MSCSPSRSALLPHTCLLGIPSLRSLLEGISFSGQATPVDERHRNKGVCCQGRLGGGEGIVGLYGSVTRTGMQKVLDCMATHCSLGASSHLVDIGAGLGRFVLVAHPLNQGV